MPVQTVIKTRRDTAANWVTTNPTLAAGEAGYETDTHLVKYGTGADAWVDLEYAATAVVKEIVKNSTGSTITKGQTVYISGSNGDNALISLADADTELTSSKTLGLAVANIADGSLGAIITNGLLKGINTSAATAGDSVWLSSTAGSFVFGAPPAKPAHSVYLGVVVRVHAVNGAILVKVQNGYELDELHNVNITGTIADNEVLAYDNASSMWINQTAAEAGLATAGHTHALDDLSDVTITTPSSGQAITYNGSGWVNSAISGLPSQGGNAGEFLITNGTAADWGNTVTANATTVPALIAKGKPSHTSTIFAVLADRVTNPDLVEVTESTFSTKLPVIISSISSSSVPLKAIGAASQTANLQEWQNSGGTVLASVSSAGLLTATPAVPVDTTSATNVGYVGLPQILDPATNTIIGSGASGKHYYMTTSGKSLSLDNNSAVQIGQSVVIINGPGVTTSISANGNTLYLAGTSTGNNGSRTLAPFGMATAVKIASNTWIMSGNGLS